MTAPSAERLLRVIEGEGRAMLDLAGGDLTRPVPSCPMWTVAELIGHLTAVYRWVTLIVGERRFERPSASERAALDVPVLDGPALSRVFETAHTKVVETLSAAPTDLACWTMWPAASARDYWIRRQAHETLVHHLDLRTATVGSTLDCAHVSADIAADGVDEMIMGFAGRYRERLRSPRPATIALHATDTDHRWWIRLGPTEPEFGRGEVDDTDQTVLRARGGELLLLLWNRRDWDGLDVAGSDEPLRSWQHTAHL
ncbi:MAG TPA: maleylpyruvate isomerase family mycothiol-dependent enzyme [Mycobacterium sp.]|nr:maleylpyruvate isomerase family mycothiol-dependent enzyme [Mycobacterium sp.]